uniref:Uncharacterized protein n=1 Tax=Coccidioides posadasii RMSCC 3488 TaxID=454284 RepID=A0A0J6FF06_COCPO|nr:hypothetical protein CPAG_04193 [Coccidioides posadasii RMSCC 3488]
MAPTYQLSEPSAGIFQFSIKTPLYIAVPLVVILTFLAVRKYRNASSRYAPCEIGTQKTPIPSPDKHASVVEDTKCLLGPNIASHSISVSGPCGMKSPTFEHSNTTSETSEQKQREAFPFSKTPIHHGGNMCATLPPARFASASLAECQQIPSVTESGIRESSHFQTQQRIMLAHPHRRSETVQFFNGMGPDKGRVWKRKVIEYS